MNSHPIDNLVARALQGRIPLVIFFLSLVLGLLALKITPREEEPQIVVPMIDVSVLAPNLTANQVERQVTIPLEKLLSQISGIEHIYSTSMDGKLLVTLRFHVGEERQKAIVNTYNKLYSNQDKLPVVVDKWQVKPQEVDDVPILMLGLYSTVPSLYDDFQLRRFAQEISTSLQQIDDTSEINVVGGRQRALQIDLDIQALAARQTTVLDVVSAIDISNQLTRHGSLTLSHQQVVIESGDVFRNVQQLQNMVVNIINGKPVLLKDVAKVTDGPQELKSYQWLQLTDSNSKTNDLALAQQAESLPLVTISVAKQKGSNAVSVSANVLQSMEEISQTILPEEVKFKLLRDYGQTANDKVNNLTSSLAFAIFTVVVFIGVFLGWRPALVVGLAVPVCYGLTLMLDYMFGYTINRVTLFALILSLGLLVDDPITGIDNIERTLKQAGRNASEKIVAAMQEIRPALLMSTLTIILAFIPLAFITGMMGPYMAPMAFNVPVSVMISTLVAFLVTPWLAKKFLRTEKTSQTKSAQSEHAASESAITESALTQTGTSLYRRILNPILERRGRIKLGLVAVLILFIASASLPIFRAVPLKLLPFDNKNEIQVLLDLPEGASLEQTAALAQKVSTIAQSLPEVEALAVYVGESSPIDFNGLVRGYYQRQGQHLGDIRVVLIDKEERQHQSHGVVLRLRQLLAPLQTDDISIKVVEVPPGPPVMSTLVTEVYAEPLVDKDIHYQAANKVKARLEQEAHVVEVDSSMIASQQISRFVIDKQKAALSGISTQEVNQALAIAVDGSFAGVYQQPFDAQPIPIKVKLPFEIRQDLSHISAMQLKGRMGIAQQNQGLGLENAPQPIVPLAELGTWQTKSVSQPIMRKDLRPVIYVTAELSGRTPAEVIADISSDFNQPEAAGKDWQQRTFLSSGAGLGWSLPDGTSYSFSGEGEWRITIDVFRDMGIAFAFALTGIFIVLKWQTQSTALSLIIMSAIPLTIIGIMPGFFLMNQFGERVIAGAPEPVLFTATAMIGMIALAGIVVRNSLILVEFISQARAAGASIKEAILTAGEVRMRPVLLTAGTTLLGNLIITLDPVFNGLALAIIFGIIASTLFSLLVVPMVYFLVFDKDSNPEGISIND
ncbi:efflux RND transporter permease subunit [Thalassotalea sp. PS06]|uniref:efflux RND transporter permease subunit n=1 Tax=Thalassotalea sp. PS06 TaxID=2594005 RepID=UPI0011623D95|nr:efflux RND transporter permease subunit [Thalassotalea sp. PS06]QDP00824.1 efflux RND transporter permease subunit [Thalassotalea sp. PS06]